MVIDGRPYCKKDYLKYKGFMCGICGEFIENGNYTYIYIYMIVFFIYYVINNIYPFFFLF